jgi:hypothetical protein
MKGFTALVLLFISLFIYCECELFSEDEIIPIGKRSNDFDYLIFRQV